MGAFTTFALKHYYEKTGGHVNITIGGVYLQAHMNFMNFN